MSAKIVKINC